MYTVFLVTAPSSSPTASTTTTDCSSTIAVSAISLLLNITLATVIFILVVRTRRSTKYVPHSSSQGFVEPSAADLDVPVAANEAYELHKPIKPREDTTYEMVK